MLLAAPLKKSSKSHPHPSEIVSFWTPPPPTSSVLNWCCPPMGEGYFLELHYIQSICRYNFLLEISYFFSGDEGSEGKILNAPNEFTEKNYKLMDIRFSTDMQSTKDTKYIFKKSDLNLPYSKFFTCLLVFFCV